MPVIDGQIHAYKHNHSGRPWAGVSHGPQSANGEEMTAAMDAVGVDCSDHRVYLQPLSLRFSVVTPIDVTDPAIDEVVAEWAATKGAVGGRIMLRDELPSDPADPRVNRAFAAAGRHGLPVNFLCWGRLVHGTELVKCNSDTVIVIDHLGLLQPAEPPPPTEPWADLPKLLALAAYPNAQVKISGTCTLSRAGYAYADTWELMCYGSSTLSGWIGACGERTGHEPAAC